MSHISDQQISGNINTAISMNGSDIATEARASAQATDFPVQIEAIKLENEKLKQELRASKTLSADLATKNAALQQQLIEIQTKVAYG